MSSGSGAHETGFMSLSHDLWQQTLAALDSGDERVREHAYLHLLAAAPRIWEPRPLPVRVTKAGH
ncbi:hypothetical protein [Actinomadura rubrisoli]|uniref:Uncharacterized protein n=1 Tax=Actinomadura rubrisoli TaxID=2530368 RepID=A0A4R5B908_9ACTN|nr:hypothetical protein [Actinomadura rubrisoli]TDD81509.1 hypothetical protein E1298_23960 [Actinomadura rubrisoli]